MKQSVYWHCKAVIVSSPPVRAIAEAASIMRLFDEYVTVRPTVHRQALSDGFDS
jgi:hypothetical protein